MEELVEDEEEVIAEEYVEADDLYDFDDETEKVAAPFDEALNEDYDAVKPAEDAVAAVEKAEESETEKTSETLEEEVIAEAFDESKVAAEEDAVVAETGSSFTKMFLNAFVVISGAFPSDIVSCVLFASQISNPTFL